MLVRRGEVDQGGEGALDQACLGVLHQKLGMKDFECPYMRSDLSFCLDNPRLR